MKMKNMKKTLSMILVVCTVLSSVLCFGSVAVSAEDDALPSWTFTSTDDISLDASGAFKYAGFYRGTEGNYSTSKGFYDMVKVDAVYGMPLVKKDGSTGYAKQVSLSVLEHSYHWDLGFAFTAPETGEISVDVFNQVNNHWGNANEDGFVYVTTASGYTRNSDGDNAAGALAVEHIQSSGNNNPAALVLSVIKGETYYFLFGTVGNVGWARNTVYLQKLTYTSVSKTLSSATVVGKGLAATDEILVRFFVDYDAAVNEKVEVSATVATAEGSVATALEGVQFIDETGVYGKVVTEEDYIYCYTVPMTAKQMTDVITFSVKINGVEQLTTDNTYTVEMYCQNFIDSYNAGSTDETVVKTAKACASMLLYGRMTQLALNYKTDALPQIDAALLNDIIDAAD